MNVSLQTLNSASSSVVNSPTTRIKPNNGVDLLAFSLLSLQTLTVTVDGHNVGNWFVDTAENGRQFLSAAEHGTKKI